MFTDENFSVTIKGRRKFHIAAAYSWVELLYQANFSY